MSFKATEKVSIAFQSITCNFNQITLKFPNLYWANNVDMAMSSSLRSAISDQWNNVQKQFNISEQSNSLLNLFMSWTVYIVYYCIDTLYHKINNSW